MSNKTTLTFGNYADASLKRGWIQKESITFSDIRALNLTETTFENCTVTFNNVREIDARRTNFINCTISLQEVDTLNLAEATITGAKAVTGKVDRLILSDAQLGSEIVDTDFVDWQLRTGGAEIANLRIGNVLIKDAAAFGNQSLSNWDTVSIIGAPSLIGEASAIFDSLKLTKNYADERPSLRTDEIVARRFAL